MLGHPSISLNLSVIPAALSMFRREAAQQLPIDSLGKPPTERGWSTSDGDGKMQCLALKTNNQNYFYIFRHPAVILQHLFLLA
jgi:hypothetical protein